MPIVTAAIIGGVASLAGGMMAREGAEDASAQDRENAQRATEVNSAEALKNREFQERMSSTAYQRAMVDMRSAGLNPILAASRGGASTPSGAAGSAVAPAPTLNAGAAGVTAAQQVANIGMTVASAEQARAQSRNLDADTRNKEAEHPFYLGKGGWQDVEIGRLRQITEEAAARTSLTDEQRKLVHEEIKNAQEENRRIQAHTGNYKADTALKWIQTSLQELQWPEAHGKAQWHLKYPTASRERNWPDTSISDIGRWGAITGNSAYNAAQGLRAPSGSNFSEGKIRW